MDYAHSEELLVDAKETEYLKHAFVAFNGMGARLDIDGNQWCAIWGDMPEKYIAGFGDTPNQAILNFYNEFRNQKLK